MHPLRHNTYQNSLLDETSDLILSRLFVAIGIVPSRIGFTLLKDAVAVYCLGEKRLRTIQSTLASRHGISVSAVERDIRAIIETAAYRNQLYKLNSLLGVDMLNKGEPIPAKEFIALVSECLFDPRFRKKLLGE